MKRMVKCLICGAEFEEGADVCPVCFAGPENFVVLESNSVSDSKRNTDDMYLILGGGAAGISAAEAIREQDETGRIVILEEEEELPYRRPALTKQIHALWNPSDIAVYPEDWYTEKNIQLLRGKKIVSLDTAKREVRLSCGTVISYDKCIYALGAESFVPPFKGSKLTGVRPIRTVSDIRAIQQTINDSQRKCAVIIGGGVLGLEAAWSLHQAGMRVVVLEAGERLMARQLDEKTSKELEAAAESSGIDIVTGVTIDGILEQNGQAGGVRLADGRQYEADLVVLSCGIRSRTAIAEAAGISVGRAVKVNEYMETSAEGIYACGDCAECDGQNIALWQEAADQGRTAGINAAGGRTAFQKQEYPVFFQGMNTSLYAIGSPSEDQSDALVTFDYPKEKKKETYFFQNKVVTGIAAWGDIAAGKLADVLQQKKTFGEILTMKTKENGS